MCMPKTKRQETTEISARQKSLLFIIIKEYSETGQVLGSVELAQNYDLGFSAATIRNEIAKLRDLGYLYQPFINSTSIPTELAFRLLINQLITGLGYTHKQHNELKVQIKKLEKDHLVLQKELTRLISTKSGGASFLVNEANQNISGIKNLMSQSGKDEDIEQVLDFLDNIDRHKKNLLQDNNETGKISTVFEGQIGRGYGMVATQVMLGNQKSTIGIITPMHLLADEKKLKLIEAISKILSED